MNQKILLAIPQLTGGGAERVASVWANKLFERGYDVSILLFARHQNEYTTLPSVQIYSVASTVEEYKEMPYSARRCVLRRTLKELRPTHVISFLPSMQVWMMMACRGLGIKRIETIRVNPWRISVQNPLKRTLWHMCYHTGKHIIVQTNDQTPYFSKKDQKKCILIPNPISPLYVENFREDTPDEVRNFVAAGRLDGQKNYPMMINAFRKVADEYPDARLRIFGTGSEEYKTKLEELISSLGLSEQVFLMGRTPHMEEEYKKGDAFLMTSDFEGLPNALAEAMASRLLVVSTDCKTGPRDFVEDGVNGFLVPVGDIDRMAETVLRLMKMSKEERAMMQDAAREKILSHCSEENSIEKLCTLLK